MRVRVRDSWLLWAGGVFLASTAGVMLCGVVLVATRERSWEAATWACFATAAGALGAFMAILYWVSYHPDPEDEAARLN